MWCNFDSGVRANSSKQVHSCNLGFVWYLTSLNSAITSLPASRSSASSPASSSS
ncbi:unnamed protein product [Rhodiola kirilowii]